MNCEELLFDMTVLIGGLKCFVKNFLINGISYL